MTHKDFIYWLQAYFEIPDHKQPVVFTTLQIKIIRRHLAMLPVAEYERKRVAIPNYGKDFCLWLNTYLRESDEASSAAGALTIKQKLYELFEHVV